jgi:glycosyltransferase involved in cell wall biosynthesis
MKEKGLKIPLKIAICTWSYGIGGGAGRMETYYYQNYDRELFDPHIISLVTRPTDSPSYDENIPFIQIDQKNRFFHLVEVLQDFDIVQFQGSFNPLVCEASKFIKKPHILLEVLHNIEDGALFENIDGTISVSTAVDKVQKPQINRKTILNGIKIKDFPFKAKDPIKEKIILLQVARREKVAINLDEIASEILALDPRIEIWIAGGEHNFPSTDRIKFLGVQKNIVSLYHQAHFMVLLSKEEPFGLVALESMACGTPVILSKSGGFLDIIKDNSQGYLVEGPTKEEAIKIIKEAISIINTPHYEALIETGNELVKNKFRIEDCVKSYEDYILELYKGKAKQKTLLPEPIATPPNALVGEALYDFQANNIQGMVDKLIDLSLSPIPITEIHTLKTAHDLAQFIKFKHTNQLPAGIFPFLFFSGDRTEFTCNEVLNDIEYLKQRNLFQEAYNYFEETKLNYPERWEKIKL